MAPPSLVVHVHVSEREVAHTWPDGQKDDAAWEDCTWMAGLELARLAHDSSIAATHAEGELLRDASGEPPTGGSSADDLNKGYSIRYHWSAKKVVGFDALWAALKPGFAAMIQGKTGAFPPGHRLRRWQPGFTSGHAIFGARVDAQDRVWWCDPLAPKGTYDGEWVTKAELRTYVTAFAGSHLVAQITQTGATDVPNLSSYLPGYTCVVKKTANIRSSPDIASGNIIRAGIPSPESWVITGTVKGDVDPETGKDQWVTRWNANRWEYTAIGNLSAGPTAPTGPVDCAAQVKAATDPLNATIEQQSATIASQTTTIAAQTTQIADLEADVVTATGDEKERIAKASGKAEEDRIRAI